jgi:hypothetical protein
MTKGKKAHTWSVCVQAWIFLWCEANTLSLSCMLSPMTHFSFSYIFDPQWAESVNMEATDTKGQ